MNNEELKAYAKKHKVFQYQIAEHLGLAESKLSTMYRKQISAEMQNAIIEAVNALSKEKAQGQPVQAKTYHSPSIQQQDADGLFSGLTLSGTYATADSEDEAF